MSTTIQNASIFLKDKDGNVGQIKTLTANDVSTVQNVIDKAVLTEGAQTVAGDKTFTGYLTANDELRASKLRLTSGNGNVALTQISASDDNYSTLSATNYLQDVDLLAAGSVRVPVGTYSTEQYTTDSTAASRGFVQQAINTNKVDTSNFVTTDTEQTITGTKTLSATPTGSYNLIAQSGVIVQHATAENAWIKTATTKDGKVALTSGTDTRVSLSSAQQVTVPTITSLTTSSDDAASTAFVQSLIADKIPDTSSFVTTNTEQTISGHKTFTAQLNSSYAVIDKLAAIQSGTSFRITPDSTTYRLDVTASGCDVDFSTAYSMNVPTLTDLTDSSTKAASTAFVQKLVTKSTGAMAHQGQFRGIKLISDSGAPFASVAALHNALANNDYSNIYLGDWFKLKVNGLDTMFVVSDLCPDNTNAYGQIGLLVIFNSLYQPTMNTTDSTDGGFQNSTMYNTTLPALASTLASDSVLGNRLVTRSYLATSSIDTTQTNVRAPMLSGVSASCGAVSSTVCLPSEVEFLGFPALSSSYYDCQCGKQIPLFQTISVGAVMDYLASTSVASFSMPNYVWTRSIASSRGYVAFDHFDDQIRMDSYTATSTSPGLILNVYFK